ncbi:MAG: TRAP transporter large permease [Planctomycetaceae bacterium]|nr:TRAP transporter large permease [Planctomycetaceae bacterium]
MITFLLSSFFVILAFGAPIAVALGLSSALCMLLFKNANIITMAQRMFEGMNSFALLAIPFYTFAGALMSKGGISKRIIDFCYSIAGHVIGGLAHVNVLASMVFAGISGSAVADTAGVGGLLMPEMVRKKYSKEFTVAVTAISSTIGIVIPPSIPMVVIAGILSVSTGKLFLSGIIPGILMGVSQMVVAYFLAKKEGVPKEEGHIEFKRVAQTLWSSLAAILMPFIIIGSIVMGVVSPTEAGVIAVLYGLLVGGLLYRELTLKYIWDSLRETAKVSAKVFIIIGAAALFTKILTTAGFHIYVRNALLGISTNPTVVLLIIMVIMLVVTTFMESIAALTLLMPVLYPIVLEVGIDPIFFYCIVVVCIGIGLVTPPVGMCLYVACDIMKLPISRGAWALLPFMVATVACLVLMLVFPQLVLWPTTWIG